MKETLCTFLAGDGGVSLAYLPCSVAYISCDCCCYDTQYHEVVFLDVMLSLLNLFGCELQCF